MENKLDSQSDYIREIAKIIAKLPVERAAEVYDFARFLLSPPPRVSTPLADEDDWLNDSPEEIAKEDRVWDAAYARNQDKLRAMAAEAASEYKAGETTPLYDEIGQVLLS